MKTPESHRETGSMLQGKTNMSKVVMPEPEGNGDAPEQSLIREELEKALNETKRSEAQLRKIIDTIPTLAWCSLPDGSKEFFNQRWHGYTGLSPEEAQGWGWKVTIHPEDVGHVTDTWRTCLAAGEPGEVEGRLRRCDGAYRWFLFRAAPLRDAL